MIAYFFDNRLSKLIYKEKFLGEANSHTAEYMNIFEEQRRASTTKLPLEISFESNFYTFKNLLNIE